MNAEQKEVILISLIENSSAGRNTINKIRSALADYKSSLLSAVEENEWIDVKERLPEDNKEVIVFDSVNVRTGFVSGKIFFFGNPKYSTASIKVTRWQPLPTSPTKS